MFKKINDSFNSIATNVNNNKYFYGLMMILLNVGSKYLTIDLSAPFHKAFLSSVFMRRVLIFTVIFIATRDLKVSLILTASFVIIALNLFNDKSKFCILPKSFKNLDVNMDGEITPDEIERAYNILKKTGKLPTQVNKFDNVVKNEIDKKRPELNNNHNKEAGDFIKLNVPTNNF